MSLSPIARASGVTALVRISPAGSWQITPGRSWSSCPTVSDASIAGPAAPGPLQSC